MPRSLNYSTGKKALLANRGKGSLRRFLHNMSFEELDLMFLDPFQVGFCFWNS
jgi:hypothetical protein